MNYYRSSTLAWCSQKQAGSDRPRRPTRRRAAAAEGKAKGESRKQDLNKGLKVTEGGTRGHRSDIKAFERGRDEAAGAWKVGQIMSRTGKRPSCTVPLTGMDLLWYRATQIVLFDLELLERLEWPTMAISDLSFACICPLVIHGTHH